MFPFFFALFFSSTDVLAASPSYNGLGLTPQMGWDNWNSFGCSVKEELLLGTAEKIVKLGLKDLGYNYIILDDCWSSGRSSNGSLLADDSKFPHGMKYVAEQLHNSQLKFGMYSSAGEYTCAGYAGSLGYEDMDAATFASWDVDYLKYDNCYNKGEFGTPEISYKRYKAMSDALNKTGRPIFYSLCNWGQDLTFYWGSAISNSWRMSGDVYPQFDRPDSRCPCSGDEYDCSYPGFHCSIMNILNKAAPMGQNAAPGGWNDLDMLEVGVGNMSDSEEVAHFSMWAIVKSPLIIGADIDDLKDSSLSVYSNPAVIAINQDVLGTPATRIWKYHVSDKDQYGEGEIQLWSGPLDNGDHVVALLNGGNNERSMNASWNDIFIDYLADSDELSNTWGLYDLWARRMSNATAASILSGNMTSAGLNYNVTQLNYTAGIARNDSRLFGDRVVELSKGESLTATVPGHGVALFRLRPE
uniref:Alpha-galactosidase n=1 Tax=Lachancea cidri TaxID=29831 RepID=MEL_LACCI|nr:RecName: Full=Alpha-galactosidase; AltName: Full=Alpha-D-galactoside galactohydrolase; AltName: Full=Melibiase; Flags: Precursor [Lachancea cidri]AAA35280.1 alpha-galactosidase [Lachancea cidri]